MSEHLQPKAKVYSHQSDNVLLIFRRLKVNHQRVDEIFASTASIASHGDLKKSSNKFSDFARCNLILKKSS